MESRLTSIDAARGCAVLLVVYLHASTGLAPDDKALIGLGSHPLRAINWMGGAVRMPLLMLLSGLLAAGSRIAPGRHLRRCWQMLWLFAVWSAITLASHGELAALPRQLLLPASHMWYLWLLLLLTAAVPLLRRLAGWPVVMGAAAIATLVEQAPALIGEQNAYNAARYCLFFFVGFYCGAPLVRRVVQRPLPTVLFSVLLVAASHWINAYLLGTSGLRPLIVVERLAAALALLACLQLIPAPALAWPAWLGRRTLPIYLAHPSLLVATNMMTDWAGAAAKPLVSGGLTVASALLLYGLLGHSRLFRAPALASRPARPAHPAPIAAAAG